MSHLLAPVGLGATDTDVYLALVRAGTAEVAEIAEALDVAGPAVEAALGRLVTHELALRDGFGPSAYRALSPDEALPLLIARRRRELVELQRTLDERAEAMRATDRAAPVVEHVEGRRLVDALSALQATARTELLIVDAPPYLPGGARPNDGEFAALGRGVAYRVVYHHGALGDEDAVAHMRRCVEAGEEARLLADAGPKMAIADRRLAVVVDSGGGAGADADRRLVVRASTLLDLLVDRFERLWDAAVPVDAVADDPDLSERDRQVLALLASGMKDRAVAHALGVTERTIGRRVTDLMERLDATTRFRAGVRAAQRGWIDPDA